MTAGVTSVSEVDVTADTYVTSSHTYLSERAVEVDVTADKHVANLRVRHLRHGRPARIARAGMHAALRLHAGMQQKHLP